LAMSASWDPKMAEAAQAVAAKEARADGFAWTFAPMVDIARDPRWGRIVEGAGEDPFLGAAMARAQVKGFQGDRNFRDKRHVLATLKHFVGHGQPAGALCVRRRPCYLGSRCSKDCCQLRPSYGPPANIHLPARRCTRSQSLRWT